ncbi:MAG: molybdopterin-binding protein [Eubacteriaceae bacterium]|nr:molybdopterin-binding protein [Eubacteriaceae bacterium]
MQGIIKAVCVSDIRGVQKKDASSVLFKANWGAAGDAHAGDWHRQVSLLSYGKIQEFNDAGAGVGHGDFGENLVVDGLDLAKLPVGTRIKCGQAVLEVTQIGKECHTHCQIFEKMGDCIMPREGIFAKVLEEGTISTGDSAIVLEGIPTVYRAAIITLSDSGSKGERVDESGPVITGMLKEQGYTIDDAILLPDDRKMLEDALIDFADRRQTHLVLTTGGTGFSSRDTTPEATMAVATRNAPGIAEAIRAYSMNITGRAMLSRAVSVIRGNTLIVNLPGSPKAAKESLECILPHIGHGIDILIGDAFDCAQDQD